MAELVLLKIALQVALIALVVNIVAAVVVEVVVDNQVFNFVTAIFDNRTGGAIVKQQLGKSNS